MTRAEQRGFTLLEVMMSIVIVGGLLATLMYTLNYHLEIAQRQEIVVTSVNLAKEKMYEMEKKPAAGSGQFTDPYRDFSYTATIRESSFPGMSEISVVVKNGKESIVLSELIPTPK